MPLYRFSPMGGSMFPLRVVIACRNPTQGFGSDLRIDTALGVATFARLARLADVEIVAAITPAASDPVAQACLTSGRRWLPLPAISSVGADFIDGCGADLVIVADAGLTLPDGISAAADLGALVPKLEQDSDLTRIRIVTHTGDLAWQARCPARRGRFFLADLVAESFGHAVAAIRDRVTVFVPGMDRVVSFSARAEQRDAASIAAMAREGA